MSVENLISDYANDYLKWHMYTDVLVFDEIMITKKIIFVASLWSGTSQLAFRKLCDILRNKELGKTPVLVLDGDSCATLKIVPKQLFSGKGDGLLLFYDNKELKEYVSGSDLQGVQQKLNSFLSSVD